MPLPQFPCVMLHSFSSCPGSDAKKHAAATMLHREDAVLVVTCSFLCILSWSKSSSMASSDERTLFQVTSEFLTYLWAKSSQSGISLLPCRFHWWKTQHVSSLVCHVCSVTWIFFCIYPLTHTSDNLFFELLGVIFYLHGVIVAHLLTTDRFSQIQESL